MARKCRDQMVLPGFPADNLRAEPILEKPLTPEERRKIERLYRVNQRLVWKCQAEMASRFPSMTRHQINACVDDAFMKAARILDADKGKLSTRFYVDARGECTHWLRAHGYGVSAPGKVRELGGKLRQLMGQGLTTEQAARELSVGRKHPITLAEAKDALVATAGIAHEVNNWEAHYCPRPQPWEVVDP